MCFGMASGLHGRLVIDYIKAKFRPNSGIKAESNPGTYAPG